ncbi:MAG UNVERIFIED_CONTAM: hypothetical protein LVR18_02920 [Planctomycetaceae bacterium]
MVRRRLPSHSAATLLPRPAEFRLPLHGVSSVGTGNVSVSFDPTSASIAPRFLVPAQAHSLIPKSH